MPSLLKSLSLPITIFNSIGKKKAKYAILIQTITTIFPIISIIGKREILKGYTPKIFVSYPCLNFHNFFFAEKLITAGKACGIFGLRSHECAARITYADGGIGICARWLKKLLRCPY